MKLSRRQIWTALSTIYLLVLTGLAAYALHANSFFSLPIKNIIPALTLALPALTGIALETSLSLTTSSRVGSSQHMRPYVLQIVSAAFLVFEAVLATLAGTHLSPPGSLECALRERWTSLRHNRDELTIRRIQDAFDCCGFRSVLDMAWPFQSRDTTPDACTIRFQRDGACFGPWREAERRVAGMMLAVAIGVFLWQMLFLYMGPEQSSSWLPSTIRLPQDAPRQIAYRDEEEQEESSVAGEVRRLNTDSRLASHIEQHRTGRLQDSAQRNEWTDQMRDE